MKTAIRQSTSRRPSRPASSAKRPRRRVDLTAKAAAWLENILDSWGWGADDGGPLVGIMHSCAAGDADGRAVTRAALLNEWRTEGLDLFGDMLHTLPVDWPAACRRALEGRAAYWARIRRPDRVRKVVSR